MFNNELWQKPAGGAGGDFYTHQIANSVRVENSSANSTATNYFYRDGDAGNRDTWTLGMWIKRARISTSNSHTSMSTWGGHSGSGSGRGYGMVNDYTGTINGMSFEDNNGSSWHVTTRTSAVYRDLSAWTHVCWRYDSTQSTASDRARMYVNGELITDLQATTYPAQNADHSWNSGGYQFIGTNLTSSNGNNPYQGFDGYIAEVVSIDGTSLDPMDNLVETKNGVIIPKDPSGLTFGTNGFWLKFTNSSALGEDFSGNDNDFTVAGIAAHDQMLDTPTFNSSSNGGNFPTWNWLVYSTNFRNGMNPSYGNTRSNPNNPCIGFSTMAMTTGKKWYIEAYAISTPCTIGIFSLDSYATKNNFNANYHNTDGIFWHSNGQLYIESNLSSSTTSYNSGDVVAFAVDLESTTETVKFYKNGSLQTTKNIPSGFLNRDWFFSLSRPTGGGGYIMNAGQDSTFAGTISAGGNSDDNGFGDFKYSVPSGYLALCSGNLGISDDIDPAQTNDNYPQKLFGAYTYVGNNDGDRTVSTNFQADKVWIKVRSIVDNHYIQDSTRGFGFSKSISPNATGAQGAQGGAPSSTKVDSVSSSNMVVTGADFTYSSATYVAWLWRANGGTTSTNTQGSTDSTVQVDPSGHFSIVKFEGQNDSWGNPETIGHGLSSAPTCMILKNYDKADEWSVFFSDYGNASIGGSNAASNSLVLNSTAALYTNQSYKGWGGVMPTSTVFTVDGNNNNGASESIVVYCFANCEGYIKSGTYVGNGNGSDGTFVYTGFKPAWVMVKKLTSNNWRIEDNARDTYNPAYHMLVPNSTAAEDAYTDGTDYNDFLSNGFKLARGGDAANWNADGETYAFLAMAHNPFKYATAR